MEILRDLYYNKKVRREVFFLNIATINESLNECKTNCFWCKNEKRGSFYEKEEEQEDKFMSVITELIRVEANGAISFGNYELDQKSKISDFEYNGDLYKVKTFKEITKLERNGMFAYESVPGTTVTNYKRTEDTVSFEAEGIADTQVIIGVEDDTEYSIIINGVKIDEFETNLSGKLVISLDLSEGKKATVTVEKL